MDHGPADRPPLRQAVAVADVGWFTTENLFREADVDESAYLLLSCMDYRVAWLKGFRPWSRTGSLRRSDRIWDRTHILPAGWMKTFPSIGMRPIARGIRRWWDLLAPDARPDGLRRGLLMTYPYYIHLAKQLRPDFTIYYNVDDYALYWPKVADQLNALEREVIRDVDLTVCVSRLRTDRLKAAVPEAAHKIRHLPHGTPNRFLADHPLPSPAESPEPLPRIPRPWLGFIGSLEDRLDWPLMNRLAEAHPEASFVIIGRPPAPSDASWYRECRRFLDQPNVHPLGWRPQSILGRFYQTFDINLIPYRMDHPFNIVCNPTKIMDAMGATRPIVATAIPECRLYPRLLHVAGDADSFLAAVKSILEHGSDDGLAERRFELARKNTCRIISGRIFESLDESRIAR
jgi:glycosyltransferase involved in cell wall biosynthesis